jgi:hypothetical protein
MKRPPSILILYPYFGKLPEWFDLFHETLLRNADVDFLFFTDVEFDRYTAPNVQHRSMSLSDYAQLCSQKLGINVVLENSYKICDLRPFFGRIHANEIKGYDFYGYGDIDLLFGDIRSFYSSQILNRYDVLSTHPDMLSGHFCLFRNSEFNRTLSFNIIEDFEEKFFSAQNFGLDEAPLLNLYLKTNARLRESRIPVWKYIKARRAAKLYLKEQYTTPFIPKPWTDGSLNSAQPSEWMYRDGLITNNRDIGRNFIYLHFMNFKSSAYRADNTPAPWEGKKICFAQAEDMKRGVSIGPLGMYPIV